MKKFIAMIASAALCASCFNCAAKGEEDIDPTYAHYRTQYQELQEENCRLYQQIQELEAEKVKLQEEKKEVATELDWYQKQLKAAEHNIGVLTRMNGDVNWDGVISICDVVALLKIVSEVE